MESSKLESKDIRKVGLKVTLPRLKILEMLESGDSRHMSAEDLYKALLESGEEIGLATVYRVLTQFESAGLVNRLNFESGHSVFEINQGKHHDHMLCIKCGRVDEFIDDAIEARQAAIAERMGYDMTDHSLYIYGVCPDCRAEGTSSYTVPDGEDEAAAD
ncbi:ferric iron uptake transcriptional regulator [Candidatus Macondimonas diazotrophica]|jgi:Fur family ferric uptake transcriptional regulator|uniref:Ferric uptake regulation protein n=1 Tax=Candidatus Macondimonas diazotrophica TaxID=2305248 RepID=A0A4Z0FA51_9GAMM|nr:ferric iron uptake transcriptional regulator [Candidatus Macondimonas diazotrophica]TFZ82490.1 ferric iron uptake transcriptional regulator [Candidatus Macondimonas diazotrophica]HBG31587.1 ferric iron uptake transcriptional regulator [Gammaproteobacteria bacterium]HBG52455.1 ferric iron uptake transcriptional regulator [Gammaproteobacteria bacterium]